MVLSRIRLANGRFTPFVQVGIGQWRVDTDLVPYLPRDVEIAEQTGGGFEFALSRSAVIAVEADYTILYREQHEPQMVAEPRPWVTFVAARARFLIAPPCPLRSRARRGAIRGTEPPSPRAVPPSVACYACR